MSKRCPRFNYESKAPLSVLHYSIEAVIDMQTFWPTRRACK